MTQRYNYLFKDIVLTEEDDKNFEEFMNKNNEPNTN